MFDSSITYPNALFIMLSVEREKKPSFLPFSLTKSVLEDNIRALCKR
ncbi:Uncharacterised protein [Vibrio cholerae]|nr:Uncharacterised protein [Vibrio cholerae]